MHDPERRSVKWTLKGEPIVVDMWAMRLAAIVKPLQRDRNVQTCYHAAFFQSAVKAATHVMASQQSHNWDHVHGKCCRGISKNLVRCIGSQHLQLMPACYQIGHVQLNCWVCYAQCITSMSVCSIARSVTYWGVRCDSRSHWTCCNPFQQV